MVNEDDLMEDATYVGTVVQSTSPCVSLVAMQTRLREGKPYTVVVTDSKDLATKHSQLKEVVTSKGTNNDLEEEYENLQFN